MALLLTLMTGCFILLGAIIVFFTKNNQKLVQFSISMAFGVIVLLIALELFPEAYEMMTDRFSFPMNFILLFGFVLLGILLLKTLDLFIPDHEVEKSTNSIHENLEHIGIVSSIALILHNIIEGMAIYTTVTKDPTVGILVTIGVGLHNIPMGMVITSTLFQNHTNQKKAIFFISLISFATFFGGLLMLFLSPFITNFILGILLSITLGMLLYISLFELFGEMLHQENKKRMISGLITGIIIFLFTRFFE